MIRFQTQFSIPNLFTQKILPDSFITPAKGAGSPFSLQTLGVDQSQFRKFSCRSLLHQTLENVNLAGVNLKGAAKEQKIEQLVDKLQLFSVALLSNQSLQSLFPSLGPISKSLASSSSRQPSLWRVICDLICQPDSRRLPAWNQRTSPGKISKRNS